jgi:hypothetical protein
MGKLLGSRAQSTYKTNPDEVQLQQSYNPALYLFFVHGSIQLVHVFYIFAAHLDVVLYFLVGVSSEPHGRVLVATDADLLLADEHYEKGGSLFEDDPVFEKKDGFGEDFVLIDD